MKHDARARARKVAEYRGLDEAVFQYTEQAVTFARSLATADEDTQGFCDVVKDSRVFHF